MRRPRGLNRQWAPETVALGGCTFFIKSGGPISKIRQRRCRARDIARPARPTRTMMTASRERPVMPEGIKLPESYRKVVEAGPEKLPLSVPASSAIIQELPKSCSTIVEQFPRKPSFNIKLGEIGPAVGS